MKLQFRKCSMFTSCLSSEMKTSKYASGAVISKSGISMEVLSAENLPEDWI